VKSGYRATLADRMGPDAYLLIRLGSWALALAIVAAVIAGAQAAGEGAAVLAVLFRGVTTGATAGAVILLGGAGMVYLGGAAASLWLAPGGSSCAMEPDFSRQDAMVMQGNVAGALRSYEDLIASMPADARVRVRAADVYAGPGAGPRRARELFDEALRIPRVPDPIRIYASNRLVDLYLGPLADPRAARAQLRTLADHYRGQVVGRQAEDALRRLEADGV
jgi:hypothetical protein